MEFATVTDIPAVQSSNLKTVCYVFTLQVQFKLLAQVPFTLGLGQVQIMCLSYVSFKLRGQVRFMMGLRQVRLGYGVRLDLSQVYDGLRLSLRQVYVSFVLGLRQVYVRLRQNGLVLRQFVRLVVLDQFTLRVLLCLRQVYFSYLFILYLY